MLRSKMATLLTIVSAMLISGGMTWQQRLLFVGGITFRFGGGSAAESCRRSQGTCRGMAASPTVRRED